MPVAAIVPVLLPGAYHTDTIYRDRHYSISGCHIYIYIYIYNIYIYIDIIC